MNNDHARRRIERLLAVPTSVELMGLIFQLRTLDTTNRLLVEIGDFLAHPDKRTRGVAVKYYKEFFVTFMLDGDPQALCQTQSWSPNFRKLIKQLDRKLTDEFAERHFGMPRKEFLWRLPVIVSKFITERFVSGALLKLTKDDRWLLEQVIASLSAPNDGEQLFEVLVSDLLNNGLLERTEIADFAKVKVLFILQVAAAMSGCVLHIDDNKRSTLIVKESSSGHITVCAPLVNPTNGIVIYDAPFFDTTLAMSDFCSERLLHIPKPWTIPLTINEGKLDA